MPKFKKKPITIEATQIYETMTIETLEGTMTGSPGDWLITGIQGEKYFCKDDIFQTTYEEVETDEWEDIVVDDEFVYYMGSADDFTDGTMYYLSSDEIDEMFDNNIKKKT